MPFRTRTWTIFASARLLLLVALWVLPLGKPVPRPVRVGLIQSTPFENPRINGVPSGMLVDVIEEAAKREHLRVQWIDGPEGGERSLETGLVDVWPGMAWTPARAPRFHITKPFIRKDYSLVSLFSKPLRTPQQCARRRVSLVNGPLTITLAAKFLRDSDRVQTRSRYEAIAAVCRGEVEAAFSETSYFHELMMMMRPPECGRVQFSVSPVIGAAAEEGLGTLPSKAELGETLRAGIDELRADGTFMRILAHSTPVSMSENEILFKEQQDRGRSFRVAAGVSALVVLIVALLWYNRVLMLHNRRVAKAQRLTEQAHAALETSMARLSDAHQRLRFQVDRMPLACIVWDTDCSIREWNPAAETIFGWQAGEAKGRGLGELLFPQGSGETMNQIRAAVTEQGETEYLQLENVSRDGKKLVCEWISAPLRDEQGTVTGVLSLAQNITDRKRLEEELRQAHKMESIGRLAGGVAHDFNNLLTVINGYCDMLLAEAGEAPAVYESIAEIRKAGGRAASLTQQLLAFSRKQILQPKPLSLDIELREHEGMFRRIIGEDIELVLQIGAGLGRVCVDAGQIHRVVMNLLANARDAMPQGGKVTVAVSNVELTAAECIGRNGAIPGRFVVLAVTDTGSGMDQATAAQIFEPFFTTKGRATATGLGLSMVHGIVSQSGGWIEVASEVGKGTAFSIFLPWLDEFSSGKSVNGRAPEASAFPGGNETILLVEDQQNVRQLACTLLKRCGYTVLDAAGGKAAVAAAESHPHRIDLLLTDLVMPGMNGTEVAAAVRRIRPEIAVMYMSGYGADVILRHGIDAGEVPLISKPFTPTELVEGVRAALAPHRMG
jgi:PAS domain S-box-containing protein